MSSGRQWGEGHLKSALSMERLGRALEHLAIDPILIRMPFEHIVGGADVFVAMRQVEGASVGVAKPSSESQETRPSDSGMSFGLGQQGCTNAKAL